MGQMEQLADQPAGQRGSSGVERCLPEALDKNAAFASPLQSGAVRTVGYDTVSVQVMSQPPPHRVLLARIRCGVQSLLASSLMEDVLRMQLPGPESRCKFGAVNEDYTTTWIDGTSADLVADALALGVKASPRMVIFWVEDGLLASPEPRKTTAHGSDPRAFPPKQRELFTRLLEARERSPLGRIPQRSLIRIVLCLWLIDDSIVLTPQARRAWRTHARATGTTTADRRRENVRAIVEQLAHPSATPRQRRAAQLVLDEGERTGRIDIVRLTAVLTSLTSPWIGQPGNPRIERALPGPYGPVPVQHHIAVWKARERVIRLLRREEIDESELDRVRAVFRPEWTDYEVRRPIMTAMAAEEFAAFFTELDTIEGRAIEAVDAFVGTLAGELGLVEAASYAAETARLKLAR
ncbi:hypothetical protein GCM10018785_24650 [Streptomyces longispororuber]|uniref:Uncharacterized protein n=1 Tax=Streptomyces longispororuber TaxID=68230 RepID=A0A919DLG0_9ACTN|nr:hypothetical protein [Streptomyces longispororuber]GHE54224.1 hypothetical protein GCM10018785_24650 [Streptomyces longispororuber]